MNRPLALFIIEKSLIQPFTGKLPVEASWIKTYGMVQTEKTSYETMQGDYYLFDVIDS